jgi:hypothetical protein
MPFPSYSQWYIITRKDGKLESILASRSIDSDGDIVFLDSRSQEVFRIKEELVQSMKVRDALPEEVEAFDPYDSNARRFGY